jgi:hypothetical protein
MTNTYTVEVEVAGQDEQIIAVQMPADISPLSEDYFRARLLEHIAAQLGVSVDDIEAFQPA